MKRLIIACVATALIAGAATATAGSLITSRDIQDRSIRGRDIARGTIPSNRLSAGVRRQLAQRGSAQSQSPGAPGAGGAPGANGTNGAQGPQGAPGANGANGQNGQDGAQGPPGPVGSTGNWGIVNRNVKGSPDQTLRSGPLDPPNGGGALNLTVQGGGTGSASDPSFTPADKAAWGNEVDFTGDQLSAITEVGFWVYTTGENTARGNPNMPAIQFEVDPNVAAPNFSTLTFVPPNSTSNQWSGYIDAEAQTDTTGGRGWWFSGATGTDTGCSQGDPCTFAEIKAAASNAVIGSVMVSKGADMSWQGAVDALRINNEVFNFEEYGVSVGAPAP